jgi:hypothetical protein
VLGGTAGVSHAYAPCDMLVSVLRCNESVSVKRQRLVSEALDRSGEKGRRCGRVTH